MSILTCQTHTFLVHGIQIWKNYLLFCERTFSVPRMTLKSRKYLFRDQNSHKHLNNLYFVSVVQLRISIYFSEITRLLSTASSREIYGNITLTASIKIKSFSNKGKTNDKVPLHFLVCDSGQFKFHATIETFVVFRLL